LFGIVNYGLFVISGIILNLTPGADTMYILGTSMAKGRKAGILSALGISTGCLFHTTLAALGLSIILAKSALAFNIVKFLGAGYLVFLGIRSILSKSSSLTEQKDGNESGLKIYLQGVMTNVLNPKVALFFLAYIPQFINPGNSFGPLPFLLLGFTFFVTGTLWDTFLAVAASFLLTFLKKKSGSALLMNKISGVIFVGLGLNLLRAKMSS
jgi:threonine/homoserine/homoserine lactone efflux protein